MTNSYEFDRGFTAGVASQAHLIQMLKEQVTMFERDNPRGSARVRAVKERAEAELQVMRNNLSIQAKTILRLLAERK